MAPPSKSKSKEPEEDVSQLRKPITLHGKPVEQILNSIHYGSPELRHLLLYECDLILECKVCRALFRDVPNFISHKRRFCSKSAADINHFTIGEIPDERVIVVQPQPVDESEIDRLRQQSSSSSSGPNLEDTLQRIRTGDIGNSYAFQVYTNAAAKLRHQKDHARITSLRPREIPTNSNAVFIDVKSTSVNIHDRMNNGELDSTKPSSQTTASSSSSNRRKVVAGKRRVTCNNTSSNDNRQDEKQLRTRVSASNTRPSSKNTDELTDRLIKELKVIQNKVKNKAQESEKPLQGQCEKDTAKENSDSSSCIRPRVNSVERIETGTHRENSPCSTSKNGRRGGGLFERTRQNLFDVLMQKDGAFIDSNVGQSSATSSKASTDSENNDDDDDDHSNKNDDERRVTKATKRSLICSKCGGIFSSRKSLQFHFKTNHTVKRMFYPCPCCSNVYYYFSALTRHLQLNHNKTNKEIDVMRQMLRSKAFSKPSPSQDSTAAKVVRLGTAGSRRSLRYKDTFNKKRLGNAPFVYSSINKGKKVSATKDPVLSNADVKTEKPFLKKETVTEEQSAKLDMSFEPQLKRDRPNDFAHQSSEGRRQVQQAGKPKKSFGDIGMQMQTCSKCCRLFGRRSLYEEHIKTCNGERNAETATVSAEKKEGMGSKARQCDDSACVVSNDINLSASSRRKGQIPKNVPQQSLAAPKPCNRDHRDSDTANPNRRRNTRISNTLANESGDKCFPATGIRFARDNNSHIVSDSKQEGGVKVSLSQTVQTDSLVKIESPNEQYAKSKHVIPGGGVGGVEDEEELSESEASESRDSSVNNGKKEWSDDTASNSSREPPPLAVKRLKSDLRLLVTGISSMSRSSRDRYKPSSTTRDKSEDKSCRRDSDAKSSSTIQDRPRRKRKVPSRNMEAVEMLQKIHRFDQAGPSEKRMKSSEAEGRVDSSTHKKTVSKQSRDSNSYQRIEKLKGNPSPDGESFNVSRAAKRRSSKIFISNKNKLECYNLSKVEKFMDVKKIQCLKCQARFRRKAALKTHIVRSHLKWSRYQCKMCGFSCFHRSECCTHISRRHVKGNRLEKSRAINNLIVDLSKKGSEVMAHKKHETIKAKNQQLRDKGDKDNNIYKNQNAHKHPRLPEKKLIISNNSSTSSTSSSTLRKQQNDPKKEAVPSASFSSSLRKQQNDPKKEAVPSASFSSSLRKQQNDPKKEAVPSAPFSSSPRKQNDPKKEAVPSASFSSSPRKQQNDPKKEAVPSAPFSSSPRKQQNELKKEAVSAQSKNNKISPSSDSPTESLSDDKDGMVQSRKVKHISHLVPRKLRMSASSANDDNTSTSTPISALQLSNSIKASSSSSDKRKSSEVVSPLLNSVSSSSLSSSSSTSKSVDVPGMLLKTMPLTSSANVTSSTSNNNNTNVSVIKRTALPFNISTRKSPRVFDTSPYHRGETTSATPYTEDPTQSSSGNNDVVLHTRHGAYTKTLPPVPVVLKVKESPNTSSTSPSSLKTGADSKTLSYADTDSESEQSESETSSSNEGDVTETVTVTVMSGSDIVPKKDVVLDLKSKSKCESGDVSVSVCTEKNQQSDTRRITLATKTADKAKPVMTVVEGVDGPNPRPHPNNNKGNTTAFEAVEDFSDTNSNSTGGMTTESNSMEHDSTKDVPPSPSSLSADSI